MCRKLRREEFLVSLLRSTRLTGVLCNVWCNKVSFPFLRSREHHVVIYKRPSAASTDHPALRLVAHVRGDPPLPMPGNHTDIERRLWDSADQLRANSGLMLNPCSVHVERRISHDEVELACPETQGDQRGRCQLDDAAERGVTWRTRTT